MRFESESDFEKRVTVHKVTVTDEDMRDVGSLSSWDEFALAHFSRDGASIEERLMGLQILIRAIEKAGSLNNPGTQVPRN